MRRCAGLLGLSLLLCLPVAGQAPTADASLEAMKPLAVLVGRWEGAGWIRQGPGDPRHFKSLEVVESRLDGRVLVIEGKHLAREGESVEHHALAMLNFDETAKVIRFRSQLASGRSGDFVIGVEDGAFVWRIPNERGTIRYTIRIENGRWHEVGHFSADGQTWSQFFEMSLEKVGP